eukprot:gene14374-19279_t
MPSRHSKQIGDRPSFSNGEKKKTGHGSITQRVGGDSQLLFGYCCLSLHPVVDAVISPSGHLYSREAILEYILNKSKELKKFQQKFEEQQFKADNEEIEKEADKIMEINRNFVDSQDGVSGVLKRKASCISSTSSINNISNKSSMTSIIPTNASTLSSSATVITTIGGLNSLKSGIDPSSSYFESRKKIIDDTTTEEKQLQLQRVSPWVPQFTPQAKESSIEAPPRRPTSPFSGQPIRAKDLLPIHLERENSEDSSSIVRYICPVSRKTITNQKVIFIKSTGAVMLATVAEDLAYPTMTCPITGKKFKKEHIIELTQAASGYASSGSVEAKIYRPVAL